MIFLPQDQLYLTDSPETEQKCTVQTLIDRFALSPGLILFLLDIGELVAVSDVMDEGPELMLIFIDGSYKLYDQSELVFERYHMMRMRINLKVRRRWYDAKIKIPPLSFDRLGCDVCQQRDNLD